MDDHSLRDILAGLDSSFPEKADSFLQIEEDNRDTFPLSNHSYRLQIAHLESRLHDYADLLKAKDREIEFAKSLQSRMEPASDSDPSKALESRIVFLEEENQHLKALSSLKTEVEQLRQDLAHASQLKSAFENKYQEISMKLMSLDKAEESSEFIDENEKFADMMKKVELFKHANSDLYTQVDALNAAVKAAGKERNSLRDEVIPGLQTTLREVETENNALEEELKQLKRTLDRRLQAKESLISIPELELRVANRLGKLAINTAGIDVAARASPTSESARSSQRQTPTLCRKSVPAFNTFPDMKKSVGKPGSRGSKTQRVITSRPVGVRKLVSKTPGKKPLELSAEAFPDENELD